MNEKPIRQQAPSELWSRSQERVHGLRSNQTPAEEVLWQRLRRSDLGLKFRRQHAIGPYIVDFYCVQAKLVIEIDGASHDLSAEYDAIRTAYLEGLGLRELRFRNEQVMEDVDAVLQSIAAFVERQP